MEEIEEARGLLETAQEACIKVLGPNVKVVVEHIFKALTIAEGNLVVLEAPTETDEEHAERAKIALEAIQDEVKAGVERQAKAQSAYNAIVAKGGENVEIYASKVYAEILATPLDLKAKGEPNINDFTEDEIVAEVAAKQAAELLERDAAAMVYFDSLIEGGKAARLAEEAAEEALAEIAAEEEGTAEDSIDSEKLEEGPLTPNGGTVTEDALNGKSDADGEPEAEKVLPKKAKK